MTGTPPAPARRARAAVGIWAAAAVAVYVGTTALGGLLGSGYSHRSMHISELTGSHAPDRTLLAVLYGGYNVALAGLGLTLLRLPVRNRWLAVGPWSLIATAAAGVLMVTWFPQDSYAFGSERCPLEPPTCTTAGTVHLVLAGVAVVLSILAMLAVGRAVRSSGWAGLERFSYVAAVVMVVTGLVGVVGPAPYLGLLERLPIGTFLLWLAVVGWFGFRRPLE